MHLHSSVASFDLNWQKLLLQLTKYLKVLRYRCCLASYSYAWCRFTASESISSFKTHCHIFTRKKNAEYKKVSAKQEAINLDLNLK